MSISPYLLQKRFVCLSLQGSSYSEILIQNINKDFLAKENNLIQKRRRICGLVAYDLYWIMVNPNKTLACPKGTQNKKKRNPKQVHVTKTTTKTTPMAKYDRF